MSEKFPMTSEGLKKLKSELEDLRNNQRPEIIKAIAEAREHGDLSENAEYHAAREKQSFIEGRIKELEDVTSRAEVVDLSKINGNIVTFGTKVVIFNDETEEESSYSIVGPYEADISKGLISTASPIARALIGKSEGDVVEVLTPSGNHPYEVISISKIES